MRRLGFTMIELIFVIVVMGIIGKFGTEFLAQAYRSFIFSSVNNTLQAQSEMAVETIASRLQFRIKDSVIGRRSDDFTKFEAPAGIVSPLVLEDYDILEWVGSDIDGLRGDSLPYWSGIIDLDPSKALGSATLISPETNTTALNTLIGILSDSGSGINNAALYFIGSDSNIKTGYGWDGNPITTQNAVMHPIRRSTVAGEENRFIPIQGGSNPIVDNNFIGVDVFEYYQLAWTAYAIGIDDYNTGVNAGKDVGTLKLWYDYQPWEGENYEDNAKEVILMDNVSTFRYKAVGSIMKIQVCTKSLLLTNEDYSLCKEKTIF
ncbi:MAG: prepilin-type N-terminal cleavage/methylation domain-containing protein [Campylobacterota bacterium]|nr:prepilin-type N-terminal cleavage/methylation domain-containing protein [Campylobacterota bacterium]